MPRSPQSRSASAPQAGPNFCWYVPILPEDPGTDVDVDPLRSSDRYPTIGLILQSPRLRAAALGLIVVACFMAWLGLGGGGQFSTFVGQLQKKAGIFIPVDVPQQTAPSIEGTGEDAAASDAVPVSSILPSTLPPVSLDVHDTGSSEAQPGGTRGDATVEALPPDTAVEDIHRDAGVEALPPDTAAGNAEQRHEDSQGAVITVLPEEADTGPAAGENMRCGGSLELAGWGRTALVNTAASTRDEAVLVDGDGSVLPHMNGRAYFATACGDGPFLPDQFANLELLGREFRYTVDLSGTDCGCNAALYFTSLAQNTDPSTCGDYYCDANEVCGVRCAEIDIQEANRWAWLTTLHTSDDGDGFGGGYGADRTTWDANQYGPNASCIDTRLPFSVTASFPVNEGGMLKAVEVTLSQQGKPCSLTSRLDQYAPHAASRDGLAELTEALAAGMTPIISYWGMGQDLSWMDGKGPTGQGPCDDGPATIGACADMVKFSDFAFS